MLALVLALACAVPDKPAGEVVDNDDDGSPAGVDCHDGNPGVHPDAPELCDGIDQDCDGEIDEDATDVIAGYPDTDRDGYGRADVEVWACTLPSGYVPLAGDCDEGDPAVNPGAVETCAGGDEDCDGVADEDDAADASAWYPDDDQDGFGDPDGEVRACEAPQGLIADGTDCDDADPGAFPGNVEVCDLYDQDCDGYVDEDDAADAPTWYRDDDEDGWGSPYETRTACSVGRGWSAIAGDCDDDRAAVNPDAVEVCDEEDEDCDGEADDDAIDAPTWYLDADHDGFGDTPVAACGQPAWSSNLGGDCDDADADSFPGGTELCNGNDDDCDGATDEDDAADAATWYADADADGFGDATAPEIACAAPAGTVADATDCDDGAADVSPAGVESCDGVDQDCDGDPDDDATDALPWYADADADTYGDAAVVTLACEAPTATVVDATDCDDAEADHNPGADETCDGDDDDCDGTADESSAIDAPTWYFDGDSDGWGATASPSVSCTVPARHVATWGDCSDVDATVYPNAPETCDGVDEDCSGLADDNVSVGMTVWFDDDRDGYGDASRGDTLACSATPGLSENDEDCDDADAEVSPDALDACGDAVDGNCDGDTSSCEGDLGDADEAYVAEGYVTRVASGDTDGDGVAELIVGVPTMIGRSLYGVVYVAQTGSAATTLSGATRITSAYTATGFGGALAAGDLDGDGLDDVAVGARSQSTAGTGAGAVWLLTTPTSGTTAAYSALNGSSSEEAGASVTVLDQDGDGAADLLVGAPRNRSGGSQAGALYVMEGPLSSASTLAGGTRIPGSASNMSLGCSVVSAGDVNGDGLDDAWVGACDDDVGATNAGAAYLFLGPISGLGSSADAEALVYGAAASDGLANGLAGGADVDGDGAPDVVLGAPSSDAGGSSSGAAWVFTTLPSGTTSVASADATLYGLAAGDAAGASLALPGDLDGDGYGEVVVGAYGSDRLGTLAGAVYVVHGPVSGSRGPDEQSVTLAGPLTWTQAGWHVAAVPDVDGDGAAELAVAGYRTSSSGGTAWLLYGDGLVP